MPLTADLDGVGMLDVTRADLGVGLAWAAVYRKSPRAPLVCRGCGSAMGARRSKLGNPFFFHLKKSSSCVLGGETPEHRALKEHLAGAIRAAGWDAAVEASGSGTSSWRADVLGTAPDGRQVAWEVQLSPITVVEVRRRTENYRAAGIEVCWVTTSERDWLGSAPYVLVSSSPSFDVLEGVWRFEPDFCEDREWCGWAIENTSVVWQRLSPGVPDRPCTGHGEWTPVVLQLALVVEYVLSGVVCNVRMRHPELHRTRRAWRAAQSDHSGWTAPHYIALRAEQEQLEAAWVETRSRAGGSRSMDAHTVARALISGRG